MDQTPTNDNKILTKTVRKSSNTQLLKKINQSVNIIASKAFQSQQCGKVSNTYSRNMLCTARMTPKVEPFRTRQNQVKNQTCRSSVQKFPKQLRLVEDDQQKEDPQMSITVGENFYSARKQNNQQNELFITMQTGYPTNSLNVSLNHFPLMSQSYTNTSTNHKKSLNTDRKWTFEQFLYHLYQQKAKDLKTQLNPKQQTLFIQRYKNKFEHYSNQELIHQVQHGRTSNFAIKAINVSGSDFGLNALRCICEFLLSNKIVKISSFQINTFCTVKTLILDKNPLGDGAVSILAQSLSSFKLLLKLSLVSVNMSSRGAKQLMKGLMGLQNLNYVNFSSEEGLNRNRLGESSKEMELILSDPNCSWQHLNISNSNIGVGGLIMISNGITKTTKIQQLILSQNDIASGDIAYFLSKTKFSNLAKLDLSNNQIGDEGFKLIIEVIGTHYGLNSLSRSLKILNLSDNQIRSYGIQFYCKNMFNNNALTELYLANNNLSKGEQFFNFKFYISKNWSLKKLDLSSCFTELQDMRHLFEGLQENRALLELKVSRNNFSVQSFVAMARMLSINKSLKVLEIDTCNITDKFLEKSGKELKQVRNIEQINFNNNYLSDKSGKILLQMVNRGKTITKLSFLKNCLGIKVQNQIGSILKANKNRKEHCKIDEKQMEYLKYVSEIQENNEESIKFTIEKLKEKEQKVKLSSLVCQVVKIQLQEESRKKELQEQMMRIQQLQQKLMKKSNSHSNMFQQSRLSSDIQDNQ